MTIPLIVLTTTTALGQNRLGVGKRLGLAMHNYRWSVVAIWYLLVLAAVSAAFYRQFAFLWFEASI